MATDDKLIDKIKTCCNKVHGELGPGFVERIYHCALKVALDEEKLDFDSEKDFSVFYQDQRVGSFKCDFFVENKIVVLVKAQMENFSAEALLQAKAYFKISKTQSLLLVNFGKTEIQVEKIA